MNRYYIEVKNVGDNGVEKLINAGVPKEDILVIDGSHPALARAIYQEMSLTFEAIKTGSTPMHVAARILYVHYAMDEGDIIERISEEFGKPRNDMINWCYRQYEIRMFGDKDFRMLDQKIRQRLASDTAWQPIRTERPKPPRRKKRKRRRKTQKKLIQRKANGTITPEILEKRQMTISWDGLE